MDIESGRGVASSAFPSFDVVDAPPAPVRSRRKGPENHAFKEHDFLQQGGGAINSFSLNQQSTIATKCVATPTPLSWVGPTRALLPAVCATHLCALCT